MSERIHVLAQQLFGKASVEACTLEEVNELAQRYPYFAPAQFLLLEKMKQEGAAGYAEQLQKSVLYYHNPLEFEYFISSDTFFTELPDHLPEVPSQEEEENFVAAVEQEPTSMAAHGLQTFETETSFREADEEAAIEQEDLAEEEDPVEAGQPVETRGFDQPITMPLNLSVALPAAETEPQPAFEPFHTVDYFASQGIKLVLDEAPKDKFGKQLKSFTEWLKTMKRLPAQEGAPSDASNEKKVQYLAADSVHDPEVITEAMAEVWIKQGNPARALEVYNKLSLLNPSKRAYFAAKIDHLKSS